MLAQQILQHKFLSSRANPSLLGLLWLINWFCWHNKLQLCWRAPRPQPGLGCFGYILSACFCFSVCSSVWYVCCGLVFFSFKFVFICLGIVCLTRRLISMSLWNKSFRNGFPLMRCPVYQQEMHYCYLWRAWGGVLQVSWRFLFLRTVYQEA